MRISISALERLNFWEESYIKSEDEIIDLITSKGFRLLADDTAAGKVFYKKGSEVLKLFQVDVGYRKFLSLVQKNSNIHLPKIRGYIRFKHGPLYNWNAVKIEKLVPLPMGEYLKDLGFHSFLFSKFWNPRNPIRWQLFTNSSHQDIIWDIVEKEVKLRKSEYLKRVNYYSGIHNKVLHMAYLLAAVPYILKRAKEWEDLNSEFAKALGLVYNKSTSTYGMDLHRNNIMKRGDVWVIIDPYLKIRKGENVQRTFV